MLVVFLGYKILILVFLGPFGKFLENGSDFSKNNPQNCNLGIFRGLKSKSGYFLGFPKKISDEHTYHFYIKSAPRGELISYILCSFSVTGQNRRSMQSIL